jgi:hypothetical protein
VVLIPTTPMMVAMAIINCPSGSWHAFLGLNCSPLGRGCYTHPSPLWGKHTHTHSSLSCGGPALALMCLALNGRCGGCTCATWFCFHVGTAFCSLLCSV